MSRTNGTHQRGGIQLIEVKSTRDQQNEWCVPTEARAFLSQLKGPIVVVVFCGDYRQGKSYAAGRCVGDLSQFEFSDSSVAKTKGIRMSTVPIPGTNVYVIDTEGLNDTQSTTTLNAYIMSLSILFADKVIFNFKHALTQDSIDRLSVGVETVKTLIDRQESKEAKSILTQCKPELLLLLRDKQLAFRNEKDEEITHKQYLEYSLSGSDTGRHLKDELERLFSRRDLYSLPIPTANQKDLVDMKHTSTQFETQMTGFIGYLKNTPSKMLDGAPMTGSVLLSLADSFCSILSRNEIPQLLTVAENMRMVRINEAVDQELDRFKLALTDTANAEPKLTFWTLGSIQQELAKSIKYAETEPVFKERGVWNTFITKAMQWIVKASQLKLERWQQQIDATSSASDIVDLLPEALQPAINKLTQQITAQQEALDRITEERDALQKTIEYGESLRCFDSSELGTDAGRNEPLANDTAEAFEQLKIRNEELQQEITGLRLIEENFKVSLASSLAQMKKDLVAKGNALQAAEMRKQEADAELKSVQEHMVTLTEKVSTLEAEKTITMKQLQALGAEKACEGNKRKVAELHLTQLKQTAELTLQENKRLKADSATQTGELRKKVRDCEQELTTLRMLNMLRTSVQATNPD